MERVNRLAKIITALSIVVAVALVERARGGSMEYEDLDNLTNLCNIKCEEISSDIIELDEIDTKIHKKDNVTCAIVKNILPDNEEKTKINRNTIIIEYSAISKAYDESVCLPSKDSTKNDIRLVPYLCECLRRNLLAQLKEVERKKNSPTEAEKEDGQMNADMDLMKRVLNTMICKSYTDDFITGTQNTYKLVREDFKNALKSLKLEDSDGYMILFKKNMINTKKEDMKKLFEVYETNRNKILYILEILDGQNSAHNQDTEDEYDDEEQSEDEEQYYEDYNQTSTTESMNITILREMFKNGVEKIMEMLKKQHKLSEEQFLPDGGLYNDKIVDTLSTMAVLFNEPDDENRKKIKRSIWAILSKIANEFIKETNSILMDKNIKKMKQKIMSIIFKKLDRTDDCCANEFEKLIRQNVEGIINVIINPIIDHYNNITFNFIKDEAKMDEKYAGNDSFSGALGRLLEFIDKVYHHPKASYAVDGSCLYFADLIELLKKDFASGITSKWAIENITVTKIRSLATLMTATHYVSETIQSLKSYSNIENPCIIFCNETSF